MADPVNHPAHYTSHPSGVECITVVEHMPFNVGNAVKYLWRAGAKGDAIEDLRKAAWYIQREISRLAAQVRGSPCTSCGNVIDDPLCHLGAFSHPGLCVDCGAKQALAKLGMRP